MIEDTEDGDILDESEAIEILVSWRDQRNKITKEQLARGFGPKRPDTQAMAKRVRCYNCDEVGHFSRDCKKPRRQRRPPPRDHKHKGKDGEKRGDVVTVLESDSDEGVFVASDGGTED
eukprot:1407337-Pyramimonas_sp.AAC.1